jgi:protocatechuate 3,4-dioxygenase beta subunit
VVVDGGTDLGGAPSMGTPSCIVRPQQTEGPFPSKMMLNRSDVRSEPGGTDPKPGLPLQLVIRVGQMAGSACKVYQGVAVDLWQCDAGGVYSSYASEGTGDKAYLRGYQMTDTSGTAEFKSIFPGSYPGRAVHVHFGVRTNPTGSGRHFISQLYFPEEILAEVFSKAPYSAHKPQRNTSDSIFNGGGPKLIPKMTKTSDGWLAEFDIGLA